MSDTYALVGPGNPGSRYVLTRHNIGFMVLGAWVHVQKWGWQEDGKRAAWVANRRMGEKTVLAIKPSTYMNRSGRSAQKVLAYYHVPIEHLLVVVDDTALPFGRMRFRPGGSAGGHNGLKSIIAETGGECFARLRMGVGQPPPEWEQADYVLAPFSAEERTRLSSLIEVAKDALSDWLLLGTEPAMNRYNPMWVFP